MCVSVYEYTISYSKSDNTVMLLDLYVLALAIHYSQIGIHGVVKNAWQRGTPL